MDAKLVEAISIQIREEYDSAFLYLAMLGWCTRKGYSGASHWLKIQVEEEFSHALKFYNYLSKNGEIAVILPHKQQPTEFDGFLQIFQATFKHEQFITSKINQLCKLADELNDKKTRQFLVWFEDEQVEEEENAQANLDLFKKFDNDFSKVDAEMAKRVLVSSEDKKK
ncbi:bacterial non-heme ferritin [Anaeramoeba ignava]|uniref:Bacterial non-heme ferritin n=1 Tax=Anaeramoeba ignava TaxID=1746090 RepID=A0A9Q0R6K4_ANAIG|nr:bacterial non-heme ferritin [Anaeramoeba ignava]